MIYLQTVVRALTLSKHPNDPSGPTLHESARVIHHAAWDAGLVIWTEALIWSTSSRPLDKLAARSHLLNNETMQSGVS